MRAGPGTSSRIDLGADGHAGAASAARGRTRRGRPRGQRVSRGGAYDGGPNGCRHAARRRAPVGAGTPLCTGARTRLPRTQTPGRRPPDLRRTCPAPARRRAAARRRPPIEGALPHGRLRTATGTAQIGVTGLAVMGRNLARNFARHGYTVAVHNRSYAQDRVARRGPRRRGHVRARRSRSGTSSRRWSGRARSSSWSRPARPTDAVIDELVPLLEEGDIVVDAGNAHFPDTRPPRGRAARARACTSSAPASPAARRARCSARRSCPAAPAESYESLGPILEDDLRQGRRRAVLHLRRPGRRRPLRQDGAQRHRVRRHAAHRRGVRPAARRGWVPRAAEIGADLRRRGTPATSSRSSSRSPPTCCSTSTPTTGAAFVDIVLDQAEQKGTGRWTVQNALDLGVPITGIAEATFARALSGSVPQRAAARGRPAGARDRRGTSPTATRSSRTCASRCTRPRSSRTRRASTRSPRRRAEYGWDIDRGAMARIWRGGCIIRARFLNRITEAYERDARPAAAAGRRVLHRRGRRRRRARGAGSSPARPCRGARPRRSPRRSPTTTGCARSGCPRPHPGAARLLRRAHLPPHRPRRHVPHRAGRATAPRRGVSRVRRAAPAPLQPVILGADIGVYALARSFHEAYGVTLGRRGRCGARAGRALADRRHEIVGGRSRPAASWSTGCVSGRARRCRTSGCCSWRTRTGWSASWCSTARCSSSTTWCPFLSEQLLDRISDKATFAEICTELGICVPRTIVQDFARSRRRAGRPRPSTCEYPLIAKAASSADYQDVEFEGKKKVFEIATPERARRGSGARCAVRASAAGSSSRS